MRRDTRKQNQLNSVMRWVVTRYNTTSHVEVPVIAQVKIATNTNNETKYFIVGIHEESNEADRKGPSA